jgi:hypothetical protein
LISDCRNSQGRWLLRPPTSTWNAFEVCAGLRRLGFCGVLPMGCACGMMIKPWYLGTVTALRVGMLVVRGYSVLFGRVAAKSLAQFCSLSAKFGCLEKRSSIYIYKYLYIYIYVYIYISLYIYIRVQTPNSKMAVNNQASGKRKVPIDIQTLWPPRLSDWLRNWSGKASHKCIFGVWSTIAEAHRFLHWLLPHLCISRVLMTGTEKGKVTL